MGVKKDWTIQNKILPGVYIRLVTNGLTQKTQQDTPDNPITPNTSATLGVAIIGRMIIGT